MKKLFSVLVLCVVSIFAEAQQFMENSYLSVNLPDGWVCQNTPTEENAEVMTFLNSMEQPTNVGLVIGVEMKNDPAVLMQQQTQNTNNFLFENAKFYDPHPATFMGKKAYMCDFDTQLAGLKWRGSLYAFAEGDATIMVVGCYMDGKSSSLPQIWRSIKWKKHINKTSEMPIRERLTAHFKTINETLKENPIGNENSLLVSVTLDDKSDCVEYTYNLPKVSKSNIDPNTYSQEEKRLKDFHLKWLKENREKDAVARLCMDNNYSYRFIYTDGANQLLYIIEISPNDYQ